MKNTDNALFKKGERWNNIDFLKFIFAIIIVYYHVLHASIMNYVGDNPVYLELQSKNADAGIIVEMFLIIAGFFLYTSLRKGLPDTMEFILSKFFRLWPVLFFAIVMAMIINRDINYPSLFNAFFLQCIGISLDYKGITWYISPYFWSLIFYFLLLKNIREKTRNVIIPVIVYFSYVININYTGGGFGRETIWCCVSLGFLRCLGGIGMGYLIAKILDYIYSTKYLNFFRLNNRFISELIFSVLEFISLGFIIKYTVFGKLGYKNNFVFVIVFCILFICFVLKKGVVSRVFMLLGKSGLGRYAYSIYAMQQVSFYLLRKTLWLHQEIIECEILCLALSVLFSILVGIMVYHFIELPFMKFYRKRMKALIQETEN